jgi:hypothetical protein
VHPPGGGPVFYYLNRSRAAIVDYQTKTYSTASAIGHGIPFLMQVVLVPVSLT